GARARRVRGRRGGMVGRAAPRARRRSRPHPSEPRSRPACRRARRARGRPRDGDAAARLGELRSAGRFDGRDDRRVTTLPITVIVPVYAGLDYTARCLESVVDHAAGTRVPFELLVIDDASPEPALRDFVDRFAERDLPVRVTVLHNEENLGFVRTVNRGLREAPADVVILNSDTAVTDGWLDRLADAAAEPDVATVTPLTSHGSICTLPDALIEAFALEGADPRIDECASFIRDHSLAMRPDVISGVGFCMYVTHRALELC